MNYAIIIGASSGGIFVLALASICLVRWYKKKETKRPTRVGSDLMPADESLGNREKYELTDKSAEKMVFCEEEAFWTKPAEGKSNEGFI